MLSKNNFKERIRKIESAARQDRFSIRKLTIGVSSVLLGFTFFSMSGNEVKADTVNNQQDVEKTDDITKRDKLDDIINAINNAGDAGVSGIDNALAGNTGHHLDGSPVNNTTDSNSTSSNEAGSNTSGSTTDNGSTTGNSGNTSSSTTDNGSATGNSGNASGSTTDNGSTAGSSGNASGSTTDNGSTAGSSGNASGSTTDNGSTTGNSGNASSSTTDNGSTTGNSGNTSSSTTDNGSTNGTSANPSDHHYTDTEANAIINAITSAGNASLVDLNKLTQYYLLLDQTIQDSQAAINTEADSQRKKYPSLSAQINNIVTKYNNAINKFADDQSNVEKPTGNEVNQAKEFGTDGVAELQALIAKYKQDTKASLNGSIINAKQKVTDASYLSEAQKSKLNSQLDKLQSIIEGIDQANGDADIDAATNKVNDGLTMVNAQLTAGSKLSSFANAAIQSDQDDKDSILQAESAGLDAIVNSSVVSDVNTAEASAETSINLIIANHKKLNDSKVAAYAALEEEATKQGSCFPSQDSKIMIALSAAKQAVSDAKSLTDVDTARKSGLNLIDQVAVDYKNGIKQELNSLVNQTKTSIDQLVAATTSQKSELKDELQQAKDVVNNIDNDANEIAVNNDKAKAQAIIDLINKKIDAINKLHDASTVAISKDPDDASTINDTEHNTIDNIINSSDTSGIDNAEHEGESAISNIVNNHDQLHTAITAADNDLDNEAKKLEAEFPSQLNKLEAALTAAKQNVAAAQNSTDIEAAKSKGLHDIDQVVVDYKAQVKHDLNAIVTSYTAKINALDMLTSSQKTKIIGFFDNLNSALADIEKANSDQDIAYIQNIGNFDTKILDSLISQIERIDDATQQSIKGDKDHSRGYKMAETVYINNLIEILSSQVQSLNISTKASSNDIINGINNAGNAGVDGIAELNHRFDVFTNTKKDIESKLEAEAKKMGTNFPSSAQKINDVLASYEKKINEVDADIGSNLDNITDINALFDEIETAVKTISDYLPSGIKEIDQVATDYKQSIKDVVDQEVKAANDKIDSMDFLNNTQKSKLKDQLSVASKDGEKILTDATETDVTKDKADADRIVGLILSKIKAITEVHQFADTAAGKDPENAAEIHQAEQNAINGIIDGTSTDDINHAIQNAIDNINNILTNHGHPSVVVQHDVEVVHDGLPEDNKERTSTLMHNAYLYDKNGDRVGGLVFNKGSIIHTSGIRKIGGVDCYVLKVNSNTYYIVASNFVARQVALKHNAYIFDENGKRVNNQVLKTGSNVNIYGDAVTIKGHKYFITDNGYVKAGNFKKVISNPNGTLHYSNATTGKKLMHNTYIFNTSTNKLSSVELAAGSVIDTTNSKDINGVKYYALDDNNYVAADNIDGVQTKTIKKARVYNKYGKKTKVVKKGKTIIIYGVPVSINGHSYYTIGKNRFIKVSTVR